VLDLEGDSSGCRSESAEQRGAEGSRAVYPEKRGKRSSASGETGRREAEQRIWEEVERHGGECAREGSGGAGGDRDQKFERWKHF